MSAPAEATYRCSHCGQTVERASTKAWIRSYCQQADRSVHLLRVPAAQEPLIDVARRVMDEHAATLRALKDR